jgi:hypothetical protein
MYKRREFGSDMKKYLIASILGKTSTERTGGLHPWAVSIPRHLTAHVGDLVLTISYIL